MVWGEGRQRPETDQQQETISNLYAPRWSVSGPFTLLSFAPCTIGWALCFPLRGQPIVHEERGKGRREEGTTERPTAPRQWWCGTVVCCLRSLWSFGHIPPLTRGRHSRNGNRNNSIFLLYNTFPLKIFYVIQIYFVVLTLRLLSSSSFSYLCSIMIKALLFYGSSWCWFPPPLLGPSSSSFFLVVSCLLLAFLFPSSWSFPSFTGGCTRSPWRQGSARPTRGATEERGDRRAAAVPCLWCFVLLRGCCWGNDRSAHERERWKTGRRSFPP